MGYERGEDVPERWEFWIDRGGTFTDVVARDPAGNLLVQKLLSDNRDAYEDAPLHAIRTLMGVAEGVEIPSEWIDSVKMGTTLATNALLERKGARVGLITSRGFGDLLEIGYQERPELFALNVRKPESLAAAIVEVDERVSADGAVRTALDETQVRKALEAFRKEGIEAVAVLFLHSFAYPGHEMRVGTLAQAAGFGHVSLSHRVAKEVKAVGRGDTTMADAYLTPTLRTYVGSLREALGASVPLRFMQSDGGLTDAGRFSGKNAILSGPAGGVVAYAHLCGIAGLEKAIGFDMGGTSTDVSRFDGRYERVYETQVAGVRLKAPMMCIETVAAGGGSILQFDGRRFAVGPESASANPGPACYRRGGPATVTDANLLLGRIQPAYFPRCFGPHADKELDKASARERLEVIAEEVERATGRVQSVESVAAGFVRIANSNMVKPIKQISVARGYDVQEYALACFGGAGPQHACAIAEALGIRTILLHPLGGVLSAYGMGLADATHTGVQSVLEPLTPVRLARLEARFSFLEATGCTALENEGFVVSQISHERSIDLRYAGVDAYLTISLKEGGDLKSAFESWHEALYGYVKTGDAIEIVNIRVESIGVMPKPEEPKVAFKRDSLSTSLKVDEVTVFFVSDEGLPVPTPTPVYRRADLCAGHVSGGPALIIEDVSTIVVDPGWSFEVNEYGHLLLKRTGAERSEKASTACDPVMLEVFNNLFMSVAEQMGTMLERVSHSANIKERLDFSCALFSNDGELVANAPHVPVHLGAMAESVRAIIAERGDAMQPGEAYLTNDPYHGGSHLPDITLVSPVFSESGERIFFVANRGHHADVGGITPGSMPPFSSSIEEEGVVIHDFLLVSEGRFREEEIVCALTDAPFPARNIPERLSDLRAQMAANVAGAGLLEELCVRYGVEAVQAYMGHVRENAAAAMRERIAGLTDGVYRAVDRLDSGARIKCTITVSGETAIVNFEGTDPQVEGNLNAPPAVTVAAVLYTFRTLIGKTIPLNGGCLDPITIRIPEGCLLRPAHPAAVVGGNVETSQRIVDVIYAALKSVAGSQGTMNNFTFGTDEWGYYETICGGAGAGPRFDGASAVHTHMTNTRITDPEVLERRYPVALREFSIRRGSGGAGTFRGGDGVTRAVEFREPMSVDILSERRVSAPYGVNQAEPGARGRNRLIRGGATTELPGHAHIDVQPGDVVIIETPGGGGYSL